MHHGLCCPPARGIDPIAVQAVLGDIDIKRAEIDRAELIQRVINAVVFVSGIRVATGGNDLAEAVQNPRIDGSKLLFAD